VNRLEQRFLASDGLNVFLDAIYAVKISLEALKIEIQCLYFQKEKWRKRVGVEPTGDPL